MRKYFLLLMLLPLCAVAQSNLKTARAASWQTFVYRINASEAVQFIRWDSIPVSRFSNLEPTYIVPAKTTDDNQWPKGLYVLIDVKDVFINARLICNTDLVAYTINNRRQAQVDIRTKQGDFVTDAKVTVKDKAAVFNAASNTWWIKNNKTDGQLLTVFTPGDTLFTELNTKADYKYRGNGMGRYKWKHSKLRRVLNWLPAKMATLFHPGKNRSNQKPGYGYLVFHQPKYKPFDTVKFKGYVLDAKWRLYKKDLKAYLNYRGQWGMVNQLISTIAPTQNGSYVGEFILSDSIPTDITAYVTLETADKKQLLSESLHLEDYLLDDISTYTLRSSKPVYFRNDSLEFFAGSKDANGLPVMDAEVTLVLLNSYVRKFYRDSLFVPDTLYNKTIRLNTQVETKFTIPPGSLPAADLLMTAKLIFKNSNNELHEESDMYEYKYAARELMIKQSGDSIKAVYVEDGVEISKGGQLSYNDSLMDVKFPLAIKVDPLVASYRFEAIDAVKADTLSEDFDVSDNYRLILSRIGEVDTLGFVISNPYQIPVYFTVLDGKKIIAAGKQSGADITWKKQMSDKKRTYLVRWQYMWAGKEHSNETSIALYYKLLTIKINGHDKVFPGQEDSVSIDVKDYRGKAVPGVNLTAVSYNNQFKDQNRLIELPYLAKYKTRYASRRDKVLTNGVISFEKQYLLGKHIEWTKKFNLDTMAYYQQLLPDNGFHDNVTLINNFIPQVSVSIVENALPQEVYLLYINRELVYYNGVTDKMPYAFTLFPGYTKIGIRLRDKYIEIDSIYIQPNYKHDISVDVNHLPAHATVLEQNSFWSPDEVGLIERSFLQMTDDEVNHNAYVWQDSRVVKMTANSNHVVGPFRKAQVQFFRPFNFDLSFPFEPGYRYSVSKQISRLEKKSIFPTMLKKHWLPKAASTVLKLGDTLLDAPLITYPDVKPAAYLKLSPDAESYKQYASRKAGYGRLKFVSQKDSILQYVVLLPNNIFSTSIVINSSYQELRNIKPGKYRLLLVAKNFNTMQVNDVVILPEGTVCINVKDNSFLPANNIIDSLIQQNFLPVAVLKKPSASATKHHYEPSDSIAYFKAGGCTITGTITDEKGKFPIPGAIVLLKKTVIGTTANMTGMFTFKNLDRASCVLVFSSVGYESLEVPVSCTDGKIVQLNVKLKAWTQALQEVVVTGYSAVKKTMFAGAATSIATISLQGKVSGLNIAGQDIDNATRVLIRGTSSVSGNNEPIYVIDGILYDELPKGFVPDSANISILKGEAATRLYGAKAANGAIVFTTQTKTFRNKFRDYAIWQPDLITNENGIATFKATYPDNITGWRTYVFGMDKKSRSGQSAMFTRAYKPVVAQLSLPRFLIEGDSASIVGKAINYTSDAYNIATTFSINNQPSVTHRKHLSPKDAAVEELALTAVTTDTLITSFKLETTTGFKDGEERKIPVYKKGTEESTGNFWVLKNDTTVLFKVPDTGNDVNIYAQNNTLDVLLEELDHLKKYPFGCMEQTASKLSGLAMEKNIRDQLKQSFKGQSDINKLLKKLQKAQLYSGGWAWWEGGQVDFYISNYVAATLLKFRTEPLVETNIRNAFLYLQNQLAYLNRPKLLAALSTLSQGNHALDFKLWLDKIPFDSLTQHDQWLFIRIKQQQKIDYAAELKFLLNKRINTMLGGVHWGEDNYSWYSNATATTVVAYDVLKNDSAHNSLLPSIIQYFLEKKNGGYWTNTVESASIINAILPDILQQQNNFTADATVTLSGDTTIVVSRFPFKGTIRTTGKKSLQITKTGGGLVFFTAWQNHFNTTPLPVADKFRVSTAFKKDDKITATLKAGETFTMTVTVNALADARYVMIEVPVPAGCTYSEKNKNKSSGYRESYKNKTIIFVNDLPKGVYSFDIELDARYKGSYTLNPAKAMLMYFPIFFGRNDMQRVDVKE